MTQRVFLDSLIKRFDIMYGTQTPTSIEFDLESKRSSENLYPASGR